MKSDPEEKILDVDDLRQELWNELTKLGHVPDERAIEDIIEIMMNLFIRIGFLYNIDYEEE